MLGCYMLFFMFLGLVHLTFPNFDLERYQQSDINRMLKDSPVQFFLLAVILAPIIEEGMFRSIIRPTRGELIFFLSSWLVVGAVFIIPANVNWLLRIAFLLLFFLFCFIFLQELIPGKWQRKLCRILKDYYRIIWLVTALIFGLVHIYNYVPVFEINLALFLVIFPRIIAGYFFGKVKIENGGLLWPITMHAMNNAAVILFLLPQIF